LSSVANVIRCVTFLRDNRAMGKRCLLLLVSLLPLTMVNGAPALRDAGAIPHLSERGRADYREFLGSQTHRAFAIGPGGSWAWRAERATANEALEAAVDACQEGGEQSCLPYAVDDRVVFDGPAWFRLWGPYVKQAEAASRSVGTRRGERFPDLAFRTPEGKAMKVSDLRGKVLVLHFWGSWCPPCQREMPDLQNLYDRLKTATDIRFLLFPVREPFGKSLAWAGQKKIHMPLADLGVKDELDDQLRLSDGSRIPDRRIASKFPTTYVLDKHGIVVFSHVGETHRWNEYANFLRDAGSRSGY